MQLKKKKNKHDIRLEEYIDEYADFIVKHNIDKFYELDIDPIVGYENVLKLRERLIKKTEKLQIPVWNKSRGKEDFIKMCEEFPYVAIGGIASKEIRPTDYKYLSWLINECHKHKSKIHGLGFTPLEEYLKIIPRDSRIPLFIQPLELNGKMNVSETVELVKRNPHTTMSIQYHKLFGIR